MDSYPEPQQLPVTRHVPYAALRHPDFRRNLAGQFLAILGVQMQTVGLGWYLYERTSSALALGGVGLAQVLPIFLLTLPAGHLADHLDRKRLLQATLLLAAACSLGFAALSHGHGAVALVYALLVLNGTARALMAPARDALGPQLLPIELLGNGATWRSGLFQLASELGPGAGGLIIGATGSATPVFLVAAAGVVVFAVLIASVRPRPYERGTRGPASEVLAGGVRFIRHTRILLATITLDLFAVLLGGATMLMPVFARDILHVGPRGLGWMLAAPSLGAVLVAVLLARHPLRHAGRALLWLAGFGALTAFGLSAVPLSLLLAR
jgi:MFS family permease